MCDLLEREVQILQSKRKVVKPQRAGTQVVGMEREKRFFSKKNLN